MFGYQNFTGVMQRLQCCFIKGYEFEGNVQIDNLKQAVINIFRESKVFKCKLNTEGNDISNYKWVENTKEEQEFIDKQDIFVHKICQNLEQEMNYIFDNGYYILKGKLPMVIIVVTGYHAKQFTIFQLSNHGFADGKSSISYFDMILSLYNELQQGKQGEKILEIARKKTSISSYDIINKMNPVGYFQNLKNLFNLITQKKGDKGEYTSSNEKVQKCIEQYHQKKQRGEDLSQYRKYHRFDLSKSIKQIRKNNPQVTKNSILTAFIVLALYKYDQNERYKELGKNQKEMGDYMSFNTVISLLNREDVNKYFGNIISVVQAGYECKDKTLEQLSVDIQNKMNEIKQTKTHISAFSLINKFVSSFFMLKIYGKINQGSSFAITNWTHFEFSQRQKSLMKDCIPIRSYISSFSEPEINDPVIQGNKSPILVVQMDPDDYLNLCITHHDEYISQCFSTAVQNYYNEMKFPKQDIEV